jgi:short-subunit dehydrogenase
MSLKRRAIKPALLAGAAIGIRETLGRRRDRSIAGRNVLVTGGSRGLGLVISRELITEGCTVAICARDQAELDTARTELELLAGKGAVVAIQCDVTDRTQVDDMVEEVTRRLGRIDILVNNAGSIIVGPAQKTTEEDIRQSLDLMLWGPVHTTFAVVPQMRKQGDGQIVNITSFGGKVAVPHLLPYSTAKFAAVGFSSGLRSELAKDGIAVTTVCPGELKSGSFTQALFKGKRDEEYRWFALGASAPWTMSAERTAQRIVTGIRRREADVTFPWTISVATAMNGIAPNLTAAALRLMDRGLPGYKGTDDGVEVGAQIEERKGKVWEAATTLGRKAAGDLHNTEAGPDIAETTSANGVTDERTLGDA